MERGGCANDSAAGPATAITGVHHTGKERMANRTSLTWVAIAKQHCIGAKKAVVVKCLNHGHAVLARHEEDGGGDARKEVMDVQDLWLERCQKIRNLPRSRSRIEGASRHQCLLPDACNAIVIDR